MPKRSLETSFGCQLPSYTCHIHQAKRAGADKVNVVVNGCMCSLQVSTLTSGASYATDTTLVS